MSKPALTRDHIEALRREWSIRSDERGFHGIVLCDMALASLDKPQPATPMRNAWDWCKDFERICLNHWPDNDDMMKFIQRVQDDALASRPESAISAVDPIKWYALGYEKAKEEIEQKCRDLLKGMNRPLPPETPT